METDAIDPILCLHLNDIRKMLYEVGEVVSSGRWVDNFVTIMPGGRFLYYFTCIAFFCMVYYFTCGTAKNADLCTCCE